MHRAPQRLKFSKGLLAFSETVRDARAMDEALFYNALAVAYGGDRVKLKRVKQRFSTWNSAYRFLKKAGTRAEPPIIVPDAREAWAALAAKGVRFIFLGDPEYPLLLREIADPPLGLYIRGVLSAGTYFSAVGTRRATPEGAATMRHFTGTLAEAGFVIVSGLAFGMDAAAHEGCLTAAGTTIAVLAGGLHDVYPGQHEKLADRIIQNGGALVSEYPLGAPPFAPRFLERNRIIAGLSRGVLIVEAPEKSGALVTARLAMEENREVFVVPGPITRDGYKGSHALIRQGAELVTSPEEILGAYGVTREAQTARAITGVSSEEKQVLKALRDAGRALDVDKIADAARLEPRTANRALTSLVLKDLIKETGGGYTI